jgi:hypothetical protein
MNKTTQITNDMDVIDSRDIIERIEELESELQEAFEGEGNNDAGQEFEDWLKEMADNDSGTFQDTAHELIILQSLAEEAEEYAVDWKFGSSLIRDSYMEDYAQELAEDIGAISKDAQWPLNCIDW